MQILALTKYGYLGASSRVRLHQYLPHLRAAGLDVSVSPLLGDDYLARRYAERRRDLPSLLRRYAGRVANLIRARRHALLWIQSEALPWIPSLIERAFLASVPYVVDCDDAIFHMYDRHPNPIVRRVLGEKVDRVMAGSALVVAGNEYLAARARSAGAGRVEVLPSVVDLERYRVQPLPPEGPFTIGWIGSPSSERFLEGIRGALAAAVDDGDTRLVLVGATERALPGVPRERWTWSEATEVEHISRFHVGIMPLVDEPWERGKCGYKLIQYMGAGRAVVASPVGVNSEIVSHGENGLLATTPEEWMRALETLRSDRARTDRMGHAGRKTVEERYALDVTAPRLAELLHSVVS